MERSKTCGEIHYGDRDVPMRPGSRPCLRAFPPARVMLPHLEREARYTHLERIRYRGELRMVREVGLDEVLGWGTPPTFGSVGSGECEIFLCRGGQGSRGKGANSSTFGPDRDETADKGVWMSVWVEDVDEVHRECVAAGLDVTFPPTDMPWNVREMHVRHPDGHVFRVSKGTGE
jgi:hypothetical protein